VHVLLHQNSPDYEWLIDLQQLRFNKGDTGIISLIKIRDNNPNSCDHSP
jgi:hypothetical protein